jgi:hypothetical protein
MSCEVGAPGVGGLLSAILDSLPQSKTTNLRAYIAQKPSRDIEKILSDFVRPEIWSRLISPSVRKRARRELLWGIVRILENAYYRHLGRHFGIRRWDDPYYLDVRDYRIIKAVRKEHGLPLGGSDWSPEARQDVRRRRLALRDRRSSDDLLPPLESELLAVARAIGRNASWRTWNGTLATMRVSSNEEMEVPRHRLAKSMRLLLKGRDKCVDPY